MRVTLKCCCEVKSSSYYSSQFIAQGFFQLVSEHVFRHVAHDKTLQRETVATSNIVVSQINVMGFVRVALFFLYLLEQLVSQQFCSLHTCIKRDNASRKLLQCIAT